MHEQVACQSASHRGACRRYDAAPDFGYNAASGEYGNLVSMGVIDPVKVVRSALENAASVAGMMLTTECLIAGHQP